jgi:hypothetical protein
MNRQVDGQTDMANLIGAAFNPSLQKCQKNKVKCLLTRKSIQNSIAERLEKMNKRIERP